MTKLYSKKTNNLLLGVYCAALAKYVLENPDKEKDSKAVQMYAYNTLADYCAKPSNHVKMTKKVKKFVKAKNEGTLEEFLGYK